MTSKIRKNLTSLVNLLWSVGSYKLPYGYKIFSFLFGYWSQLEPVTEIGCLATDSDFPQLPQALSPVSCIQLMQDLRDANQAQIGYVSGKGLHYIDPVKVEGVGRTLVSVNFSNTAGKGSQSLGCIYTQ